MIEQYTIILNNTEQYTDYDRTVHNKKINFNRTGAKLRTVSHNAGYTMQYKNAIAYQQRHPTQEYMVYCC